MKKFFSFLACGFGLFPVVVQSQNLRFNRSYNSVSLDFPYTPFCDNGCISVWEFANRFLVNSQGNFVELGLYSANRNGDSTYVCGISSFQAGTLDIYNADLNHIYVRYLETIYLQGQPIPTFGDTKIAKFDRRSGRNLWTRTIPSLTNPKESYHGTLPKAYHKTPTNTTYLIADRELYPNPADRTHPMVQEYDTSGILLREADFSAPPNAFSEIQSSCKLPDGDFLITATDNKVGDVKYYSIWVDGSNFTEYKRKYTPIARSSSYPDFVRVEAIKPGNKFLVYAHVRRVIPSRFKDTIVVLTDSSLNTNNPIWSRQGVEVKKAKALDDGNIFLITSYGGQLYAEKWDAIANTTIWRTSIKKPNIDFINHEFFNFDFDDSGNVYTTGSIYSDIVNREDIWVTRIDNVGQPWDPWNTNPQGLANENKPLSLHAYPNPTSGKFRLRGYKEEEGLTLRIFSNSGKEVWRGVPSPEGEVDISNLSPGLYHVEALTTSGKRWSTRVVRE